MDLFISPISLFILEFTKMEEINGDSVREGLWNRMWLQMAVLIGAGGR